MLRIADGVMDVSTRSWVGLVNIYENREVSGYVANSHMEKKLVKSRVRTRSRLCDSVRLIQVASFCTSNQDANSK